MKTTRVLVVGSGHLSFRIRRLVGAKGMECVDTAPEALRSSDPDESSFESISRVLRDVDPSSLAGAFLVDDHDERNLELLIALMSLAPGLPIVASLFNENVAPHLQAAHPGIHVLNPAKIAAPAFIQALDTPLTHALRYVPAGIASETAPRRSDMLIRRLLGAFLVVILAAVVYFHYADDLSWINSVYFVVVTVATVGYGDITLLNAGTTSKLIGIGLILASTVFIWMIFSLTVDNIIKRRVQLALGRRAYPYTGHVILCGLGRLGYFVADGLLRRGEKVLIIERDQDSSATEHFRSRGADVYIGDARHPRVLQDAGVTRAKALYSVISDDFVNLEVGLNARSFHPNLRLILRIFDESMSQRIKQHLDIHLTLSMSAIADERFLESLSSRS